MTVAQQVLSDIALAKRACRRLQKVQHRLPLEDFRNLVTAAHAVMFGMVQQDSEQHGALIAFTEGQWPGLDT